MKLKKATAKYTFPYSKTFHLMDFLCFIWDFQGVSSRHDSY